VLVLLSRTELQWQSCLGKPTFKETELRLEDLADSLPSGIQPIGLCKYALCRPSGPQLLLQNLRQAFGLGRVPRPHEERHMAGVVEPKREVLTVRDEDATAARL